jgi:Leucine-rich repeat (LRR) protein
MRAAFGLLALAVYGIAAEPDSLDLAQSWVTDAELARFARRTDLRSLNLSQTKITDIGLEHLKSLRGVRELDLRYAEYITDAGIAYLKGWKDLERLDLRGTRITSRALEHVAGLTRLRSLDVAFTDVSDDGLEFLTGIEKLESLAIGGNRMSGAGLPLLKQLPALRRLDVSGIQRVDSGLWGLSLTAANLRHIAALKHLTHLDLSGANISDRIIDRPGHPDAERSELRDLGPLSALNELEVLDLSHLPVDADALKSLGPLPKLRDLRLGLCKKVGDEAAPVLAALPSLRVVYLTGSGFTAEGVAALGKARPGLIVRKAD